MSMRYPGGLIATSPVNARYPSGVWTQAQAAPYQAQNVWTRDQFWPYTTLLLQGDGAVNGAQNNTFLDSSSNNFTITRNGNTTQGSFTPYEQDGYWSNYFDGSSARLTIGTQAILNVGTGNFTIECFIFFPGRSSAQSRECIIAPTEATASSGVNLRLTGSTQGSTGIAAIVAGTTVSSSTPISANTWHHVAAVRNSGTVTIYVDGVSVASGSASGSISNTASYNIGSLQAIDPAYNDFFQGYISNFRTTSTAVYTSAFTPNAAPLTAITNTFLLTCQSNRFRDNSTNNFTITVNGTPSVQAFQPFPGATTYSGTVLGGSGYFDGSGDWLNLSGGSPTAIGTGSGTVEFWMYATANDGYRRIVTSTNAGFTSGTFVARFNNGNFLVGVNGSEVTVSLPTTNQWYHIAWVGTSGTSQTVYINGVSAGTGGSYNATESINFVGGNYNSNSEFFAGYLAGVRVVKGTAVYTGAFTPPTTPPTAITNTSLLLNFTNAGIYDNSMMNNLETVGNAQVSTSVVKYGTGSMAFDGSGDYLSLLATPNLAFGSGPYTIEAWVNFAALPTSGNVAPIYQNGTHQAGTVFHEMTVFNNSGTYSLACNLYNGSSYVYQPQLTFAASTGTWYHFAFIYTGAVAYVAVNGTLSTGVTASGTCPNSTVFVGYQLYTGGGQFFLNGYIDDLRITKGAARYITNFTPPPARFPGQ